MSKSSDRAALELAMAAFSKPVKSIPQGETALNLTDHDWYKTVRGQKVEKSENDLINERHVVVDHCGRERVRNGLGEWIS